MIMKPTLDDLISERDEKAGECFLVAEAQKNSGREEQSDAWRLSGEYALATANFLRELKAYRDDDATDREELGVCEDCSKPILDGDEHFLTEDGCWLCLEHSPTLADAIRCQKEALRDPDEDGRYFNLDSREELEEMLAQNSADFAANGNRTLAST